MIESFYLTCLYDCEVVMIEEDISLKKDSNGYELSELRQRKSETPRLTGQGLSCEFIGT